MTKPLQQAEVLARITTHLRLRKMTQTVQLERSSRTECERLFTAVREQRAQLRALTNKLTEVQESERRQIARDLHDEMGQALTALRINLSAVEKALPPDAPAPSRDRLAEAMQLAEQTLEQIRELSLNLRPPMLDDLGLVPTLRWYVKRYTSRTNIAAELTVLGAEQRLPPPVETALYRVLQEALTNVARHAAATTVHLQLRYDAQSVTAQVEDNGRGFLVNNNALPATDAAGIGLLGMRERVTLLGGTFQIESAPGKGAQLWLEIPVEGQPSVQPPWATESGRVVHLSTFDDPLVAAQDRRLNGYYTLMKKQGQLFAGAPPIPFHAQVRNVITPFIHRAIRYELTPAQALQQAALAVDTELQRLGYATLPAQEK